MIGRRSGGRFTGKSTNKSGGQPGGRLRNRAPAPESRATRRGAEGVRPGWVLRLQRWFGHHRDTALVSGTKLLREPAQTLMTVLVLAVALALPGALYVAVANLQAVGGGVENTGRISVFVSLQADEAELQRLGEALGTTDGLGEVELISRDEALLDFREHSGFGDVIDTLEENPLPHVFTARLGERYRAEPQQANALMAELTSLPDVDDVSLDLQWLQRLHAFLRLCERLVLGLAFTLALGALLVVGNTISLAIQSRRDEIVVVKLVGGTDAYVRRPFLYSGMWYGLGGGMLAWGLIVVAEFWLRGLVAHLVSLYHGDFTLQGLGFGGLLTLAALGALLGLLGSWLAVGRHLAEIEPS